MDMIEKQIEFLIDTFFATSNHAGDRGVARHLLTSGGCIVAGNGRIWNGGVGNFIRIEEAPYAVGCARLTLDIDAMLRADWVQDAIRTRIMEVDAQILDLNEAIGSLRNMLRPVDGETERPSDAQLREFLDTAPEAPRHP